MGVEPIQAQDESGLWAPIDTTLEVAADGSVRPVNITEDLTFSAGGMAPLATVGYGAEGAFTLSWPDALPVPVLDGPQAVYEEVHDGVDLVVEATAQGFRYDLVVADAQAAANPELEAIAFEVVGSGVEVVTTESGTVEVQVAGQAEMMSGQALMWETSVLSEGTEAVPPLYAMTDTPEDADQDVATVEVDLEAEDLVLRPDLELLRGEDTRYPVVIDPQWDGGIQDNIWGLVNTKYDDSAFYRGKNTSGDYFMGNTGTYGNAGAGQTCDSWSGLDCYSSTYDMRSIFRMDTDTITQDDHRIANKGVFKIIQRHSASCSNGSARLYRTNSYNANTTWNTQPAWHEYVGTASANNGVTCDGSGYVAFNVTSMVQMAETNEWANLHLGLRAPSESPSPELLQWNRFDSFSAVLEITYDVMPYMPKDLKLNGSICFSVAEDAPWINDRTPAMSAMITSKDTSVIWKARLRESGANGPIMYEYTSGSVGAKYRQYKSVPQALSLPDGSYYWLAQGISTSNSAIRSDWSPPCRFLLDGTLPSTPTITADPEAPYEVGEDVVFTVSSTDPVVNGYFSGIASFEYSWGTPTYDSKVASTGTATIETADAAGLEGGLTAGRHVLYVRAVDKAGNESFERTYTFFAGRDIVPTPMAMWRFEGDTVDDTSEKHNLELAEGDAITYTTDREGRSDSALALDGNTCLTTGKGVVSTSRAYSLSAWVRMDEVDMTTERPIAQIGDANSAFQLWYSAADDYWYFSVLDAQQEWYSIGAPPTVELGEWEHLAATYDPDDQLIQLYLGGFLVGERAVPFAPWEASANFSVGCLASAPEVTSVQGAIDQVGVWQGLIGTSQVQSAMTDLPSASKQADWTFANGVEDLSGHGRHLSEPDDLVVGPDPFERPSGAVELDGQTCLEYPEPVVATDRSFTVAAWAKLDAVDGHGTVAAIAGEENTGFRLRYSATEERFEFVMFTNDAPTGGGTTWLIAANDVAPVTGQWYHLTGVYDAATGEMRIYVDGELAGTRTGPPEPWVAAGAALVGCAGPTGGTQTDFWEGALHGVSLWRGVVGDAQIAGFLVDAPAEIAARWEFNGFDLEAVPTVDISGNGNDLTFSEGVQLAFAGWNGAMDHALEFDGASHAQASGPVIDTDGSFTIATWVRIGDLAADGVAVSITGADRSTVMIKYAAQASAWELTAPPTADHGAFTASAPADPDPEEYNLLVAVFDLPSHELRLYIDGELAATVNEVLLPSAAGPLVLGAEGHADGTISDGLIGSVDDTIVWRGTLACEAIAIISPDAPETACAA